VAWGVYAEQMAGGIASPAFKLGFYAASALAVCGFAFVNPSVSALISKQADPEQQGEVLGVNQSFASLGRISGPLVGSILFGVHASGTLPFVAAVVTLGLVVTLLPRYWQRHASGEA
jgi:predicted MFS family arabinose efflux permease